MPHDPRDFSVPFSIQDLTSGRRASVEGSLFMEDGILHLAFDEWGPLGPDTPALCVQLHEGKVVADLWAKGNEDATHSIRFGEAAGAEGKYHEFGLTATDRIMRDFSIPEDDFLDGNTEALGEAIRDDFNVLASNAINDAGDARGRIDWLLEKGYTEDQIREFLL